MMSSRAYCHCAVAVFAVLLFGLPLAALAQVSCADVFPTDATQNAQPPNILELPTFPVNHDGALNLNNNQTVTLQAGDHYFTSVTTGNNASILLDGPVRIFVRDLLDLGNGGNFNAPGFAADLVFLVYGTTNIGNVNSFNGLIFSQGTVNVGNNTTLTGAITSQGSVNSRPQTSLIYAEDAVNEAGFGGLCEQPLPEESLIAHWRMDEAQWTGAAGEVLDSSPNALHGTARTSGSANSLPDTVPGKVCNAGRFRGWGFSVDGPPWWIEAQHYVQVPHDPLLSPLADVGSMTMSGWIRIRPGADAQDYTVLHKGQGQGQPQNSQEFAVRTLNQRLHLRLWNRWGNPDNSNMNISPHILQAGQWYFFAATLRRQPGTNNVQARGYLYDESGRIGTLHQQNMILDYTNKPIIAPLFIGASSFGQAPTIFWDGLIDELRFYSRVLSPDQVEQLWTHQRPCEEPEELDHLRLTHPTSGITCSAQSVGIQACADPACSELFEDEVTVTFTSPAGNWSPQTLTFTGSASTALQVTAPGSVTLNAVANQPAATAATRCYSGGSQTDCSMEWQDSGFVLEVPDHVAGAMASATIAAVRSDDDALRCLPAFGDVEREIRFWSDYDNPSAGSMTVVIDSQAVATAGPGSGHNLFFDNQGVASFGLVYPDVGRMLLHAAYSGEPGTPEQGLEMAGSNVFVARPDHFVLAAPGNPAATSAGGPIFRAAGTTFQLEVAARNASGGVTPNFGNELPPEGVNLQLSLVQPAGGNAPGLDGGFPRFGTDCAGNNAPGHACASVSWPEVGIISLNPRLASGAYLGTEDVVGAAIDHVGRFIPDHFRLQSGRIVNRVGLTECNSPFTYIGERFDIDATLSAHNAGGGVTTNYHGDFAKLGAGDLEVGANPRSPDILDADIDWHWGMGLIDAGLRLPRSTPEGAYADYTVSIDPTDSDGVALSGSGVVDSTELRFGRLVIDSAIGSELGPVDLRWRAEYWDFDTWMLNQADDCTVMELANDVTLESSGGSVGDGTALMSIGAGATMVDAAASRLTLDGGTGWFRFTAPGETGWVDVELDPGDNWAFLHDDLEDDDVYQDNPAARSSFGLFDGSPNRILLREVMPR